MKRPSRQAGFSLVEGVIVAAVVAAVGIIGYFVVFRGKSPPESAPSVSQEARAIANEADLSAAIDDLNAVDINTEPEEAALRELVD